MNVATLFARRCPMNRTRRALDRVKQGESLMPKRIGVTISSTVAMLLCMAFLTAAAHADDSTNGITVSGTAKVMGKPNAVEIGAYVSGDAELTADAVVKYRDARKRAVAALE